MQPELQPMPASQPLAPRTRNPLVPDEAAASAVPPGGKRMYARSSGELELAPRRDAQPDPVRSRRHYDASRRDRYALHQSDNLTEQLHPHRDVPLRGIQCSYDKTTRVGTLLETADSQDAAGWWGRPVDFHVR